MYGKHSVFVQKPNMFFTCSLYKPPHIGFAAWCTHHKNRYGGSPAIVYNGKTKPRTPCFTNTRTRPFIQIIARSNLSIYDACGGFKPIKMSVYFPSFTLQKATRFSTVQPPAEWLPRGNGTAFNGFFRPGCVSFRLKNTNIISSKLLLFTSLPFYFSAQPFHLSEIILYQ